MAGSPQVFVSHSKYDPNNKFFLGSFANLTAFDAATPLRAVWMEFEDIEIPPPPWMTIKRHVSESIATFVLMSKQLDSLQHTQDWVAFEVGLSCAEKKPVWVFEPEGQDIRFVAPYCTYYCPYNPDKPTDLERVKWYNDMLSGVVGPAYGLFKIPSAICPNDTCRLEFYPMLPAIVDTGFMITLRCPSCRQPFDWDRRTPIRGYPGSEKYYPPGPGWLHA